MRVSLPLPPVAFSMTTPLAIVKPPMMPLTRETKPAAFGSPSCRVASFRLIVEAPAAPAALISSMPPASQMQDQNVPDPLVFGRE